MVFKHWHTILRSKKKKKKKCNFSFFFPLPMSLYRTWQCLEGQLFCLGRDGSLSIYCLFTYIILYKTIKDGKISYVYWNNKKHKFMSKELNFEKLQQIPRFPQQKTFGFGSFPTLFIKNLRARERFCLWNKHVFFLWRIYRIRQEIKVWFSY